MLLINMNEFHCIHVVRNNIYNVCVNLMKKKSKYN